jgi:S-methylmethionine-dependent homocysteine/selenocysteine methylase
MTNQFADASKMVLSPAAQAVMDAYNSGFDRPVAVHHKPRIAAVLRAAVDLVVPDKCPPIEDFNEFDQGYAMAHITHRQAFLAIADELEGIKYGTYRCNISDKK